MGNCLVTRLNGSVQDGNLPELNTIYLDYKAYHFGTCEVCFECTGSITIESITPFHVDSLTASPVSSLTMANRKRAIYFIPEDLPEVYTQEFMKISGDIYTITRLSIDAGIFKWSDKPKASNQSLKFMPLKYTGFSGYSKDALTPSIRNFYVDDPNEFVVVDDIIAKCPLQALRGAKIASNTARTVVRLTPALKACGSLLFTQIRFSGNVADLPYNLRKMMAPSSLIYGALEDFVTAARAAGRTEGYLCIWNANIAWVITYGGVVITDVSIPKVDSVLVLQWDATNITIGDSLPAEMSDPVYTESPYYWEPLV